MSPGQQSQVAEQSNVYQLLQFKVYIGIAKVLLGIYVPGNVQDPRSPQILTLRLLILNLFRQRRLMDAANR